MKPLSTQFAYLDHHATTPVDHRVIDEMIELMKHAYANPNSVDHLAGRDAARVIDNARSEIAELVGSAAERIRFTASASDAIHKALTMERQDDRVLKIAVMPLEHPAMLRMLKNLQQDGHAQLVWLEVGSRGQLLFESLHRAMASGIDMLCMMAANNEVGTIYPIEEALAACNEAGITTLIDATQAAGRVDLSNVGALADYLVLSAHKIYGPKGIGALIVREPGHRIDTVFQYDGTPNVPAIGGFGLAARLARTGLEREQSHCSSLRDRLEKGLIDQLPGMIVNGDIENRLPHSLHISIPDIPNDAMVARIGHQIALSTGSACASGAQEPSHVLRAMSLPEEHIDSALRLSVGRFTTEAEIDFAIETISFAARSISGVQGEKLAC